MPVMVTGGFRSIAGMVEAQEAGDLDVVGLARPLIADPEAPLRLLAGEVDKLVAPEATLSVFHILPWNYMQIARLADGPGPDVFLTGEAAMTAFAKLECRHIDARLGYRRLLVA